MAKAHNRHKPTDKSRAVVKELGFAGVNQNLIAQALGITKPTLHKHYRDELDLTIAQRLGKVAANLYSLATKKDFRAAVPAMFIMKTQGGWRQTDRHEFTGADGKPIQIENLSDKELSQLEKLIDKAGIAGIVGESDQGGTGQTRH